MKDKRSNQYTINDLVRKHASTDNNKSRQINIAEENVNEELVTQEELNAIYEYNKNIFNIDEDYASIQPMSKILVRVFLLEPYKTEHGLLEPHKQLVPVTTQSGVGSLMEIESPFPYSNKAIIVAVPPMVSLVKVGDIVQLESNPVKPVATGHGANAQIFIPASYLHPSANSQELPRNSSDKHYGYLLIPFHEISTKLA